MSVGGLFGLCIGMTLVAFQIVGKNLILGWN